MCNQTKRWIRKPAGWTPVAPMLVATLIMGIDAAKGVTDKPPLPVPASVRSLVEGGATILGYAETRELASGGKHMAVVTRRAGKQGDYLYEWDPEYTCELMTVQGDDGSLRVTGRSQKVVDCLVSANRHAAARDLDGVLRFDGSDLVFSNEDSILKSGTMMMKFRYMDGRWLLRSASSLGGALTGEHEMTLWKSFVTSPKHVGFVALDDLDPYDLTPVINAVSKKSTTWVD